jgi:hypothetical protein
MKEGPLQDDAVRRGFWLVFANCRVTRLAKSERLAPKLMYVSGSFFKGLSME